MTLGQGCWETASRICIKRRLIDCSQSVNPVSAQRGIVITSPSWPHRELLRSAEPSAGDEEPRGGHGPSSSRMFKALPCREPHHRKPLTDGAARAAPDAAPKQTPPDSGAVTASFNCQPEGNGGGGLPEKLSCWHVAPGLLHFSGFTVSVQTEESLDITYPSSSCG